MTDDRHPDETQPPESTDTPSDTAKPEALPETENIEDEGEPLGANLA